MRWISKDDVEACLTQRWRKAASDALAKATGAGTNEKRKVMLRSAQSAKIWRDFYGLLPETLRRKCWYCEAEEIRSDMPVDHFRPKGAVTGVPKHKGYWWLAYDWANYRCSCTFCNSFRISMMTSGGKQNNFPLFNESSRAFTRKDNVARERPALLDPFEPGDEKLTWFDEDGKPIPSPQATSRQKRKVKNSVRIFHLDEIKLLRKRNLLRLDIVRDLRDLRIAKRRRDQVATRGIQIRLRGRVKDTAMLSSAAIVYLRPYRHEFAEVRNMLNLT